MSGAGGSVRAYAEARGRILTAAARRVPLASIAQQARALSLWDGKRVVPGDEMQLALVLDLGVLDPLGGHARGIDRQAKAEPPEPGSDDARMLAALQGAAFGLYRLRGPHPEGGAAAEGLADGQPVRIHDNSLGQRPPGTLFGARLAWPEEDLAMGCGAMVSLDSRVLERLLDHRVSPWRWTLLWATLAAIAAGTVFTALPQRYEWAELVIGVPVIAAVYMYVLWRWSFGEGDRALFRKMPRAEEATLPRQGAITR